jgi:hypothetical protein
MERGALKEKIAAESTEGKIACSRAWALADELHISRKELGDLLNEMEIKVRSCQLGCFP